jgi:hypothetical protein
MSDSVTSNYHFTLPAIGASQDSWGNKLNSNFTALDGIIHSLTVGSGGGLPITGGTISGNLTVTGNGTFGAIGVTGGMTVGSSISVGGNMVVSGSTSLANVAVHGTMQLGDVLDWTVYRSGGDRVFQWQANCTDVWHEATAVRYWNNARPVMSLDYNGNLNILGDATKPGGGPWGASSDDRVKQNIQPYTSGLARIMALEPISFQYNGKGGTVADGVTYRGLSAQATRSVMPELVFEQKLGTRDGSLDPKLLPNQLGTNLGPLTLALVNAVKELAARVAALEARCPA